MSRSIRFDLPTSAPEVDHPREERREEGNPERHTWTLYEPPGQGLAAGIWDCEPGRWRIVFGPNEHEYFVVLSGRVRVHDVQGGFQEAGPGEAIVIPPGFEGSFEVIDKVRKHFVIVDR